jgi:dTDP-4-amino-4,6-dideoxygalactose transaminase
MQDFQALPAAMQVADRDAALRVLASGHYVLGKEVAAFEAEWAAACGSAAAVGVGNGMDAIEISLRAIGIGPGDEVVTTAMTACATVLAIVRAGAVPVLADIDPGTGLLDRDSVARCLSTRTRALLLVHLYGQMRDVQGWQAFTEQAGIVLLEDCAQAHLAREGDRVAGTFGPLGAYSFYPTKNLGAAGDGGAIIGSDPAAIDACRVLRDYGQRGKYHHVVAGLNSRLDEMQAAILRARLPWLQSLNQRRRDIATRYRERLSNPLVRLLEPPLAPENHVHHLFVVRCERRDELAAHLRTLGVDSAVHYPVPMHRQEACRGARIDPEGLPATEAHARTCLSLPCHPFLDDASVEAVVAAVDAFR